ncbi:MAG TPA: hypothetical protein VK643_04280, partial [Burkholderiales bacterium]|nr:hypothetical protein [Burkholderiales bacterium]
EKMQKAGMIKYDRGCIIVPDRKKLEAHVCECYAVVRAEFDRLLPRNRNLFGEAPPATTQRRTQPDRREHRTGDAPELVGAAAPAAAQKRAQSDRRERRTGDARELIGARRPAR